MFLKHSGRGVGPSVGIQTIHSIMHKICFKSVQQKKHAKDKLCE